MYKNLTRFTASDSPAARWSLARVIIITKSLQKNVHEITKETLRWKGLKICFNHVPAQWSTLVLDRHF